MDDKQEHNLRKTNSIMLAKYLKDKGVWFRILEKETTVHTADAAAKTGIPLERITKSLVFISNDIPILAIVPGNCRVDEKKLTNALKLRNVELAPFDLAKKYSGYEPGATCPVCHKIERVVVDKRVLKHKTVFGGGGNRKRLIELKPKDIIKLNNAIVADISSEKE